MNLEKQKAGQEEPGLLLKKNLNIFIPQKFSK